MVFCRVGMREYVEFNAPPLLTATRGEEFHALANVVVLAGALDRKDAVPLGFAQVGDAGADVRRVHTLADRHLAATNARLLASHGRRQGRADVLDVDVAKIAAKSLQVFQRIATGNEGVAGIEVQPEVFGVKMGKQAIHEIAVGGVWPVRLHVEDDVVVFGPGEALLVVLARDMEDLVVAVAFGLEGAVGGVDDRAAHVGGEADGLLHVLHAERRALRPHQRKCAVDLRYAEPLLIQVASQRGDSIATRRPGRIPVR